MLRQLFLKGSNQVFSQGKISRSFVFAKRKEVDKYAACKDPKYIEKEYDVAIIGGGSGGIACANKAHSLGLEVAVFDYVEKSPHGATWGLGGTCVNVGCVPKKLFHQAGIIKEGLYSAHDYGFEVEAEKVAFDWNKLTDNVQRVIKKKNFDLKMGLLESGVSYLNQLASLSGPNELLFSPDVDQIESFVSTGSIQDPSKVGRLKAKYILLAVGGRPNLISEAEVPGASHFITSDEIFNLRQPPGKTLIVGAGYIGTETFSFLHKLGFEATLLARSTLLRGFDEGVVDMMKKYMVDKFGMDLRESAGVKSVTKLDSGKFSVEIIDTNSGKVVSTEVFDTLISAVSRHPQTRLLNLERVGVQTHPKTKKILGGFGGEYDLTSLPSVYSVGDVLHGAPELTSTAAKSGLSIAHKLIKKLEGKPILKGDNVSFEFYPTTIFAYPEYSTCGLSEQTANEKFGANNVQVYHLITTPLEESMVSRKFHKEDAEQKIKSYFKVICRKSGDDLLVVGLHYVGLNAGEIMQGFAVAVGKGLTKDELDAAVGIHPTIAEDFTGVNRLKTGDNEHPEKTSC